MKEATYILYSLRVLQKIFEGMGVHSLCVLFVSIPKIFFTIIYFWYSKLLLVHEAKVQTQPQIIFVISTSTPLPPNIFAGETHTCSECKNHVTWIALLTC